MRTAIALYLFKISAAQCGHYFIIFQKIQKNFLPQSFIKLVEFCKFMNISLKNATNCVNHPLLRVFLLFTYKKHILYLI